MARIPVFQAGLIHQIALDGALAGDDALGSVLLVGNFLSASIDTYSVCEELANRLELQGWTVHRASTHVARLPRLADMVFTVLSRR
ncbi:unnamed protein product, partial [marine sediment metagenome]